MPLSKPKMRNQIHSREIKCFGYKRGDGFWDIEGSMIDTKSYSFDNNDRGGVSSGEPIHYMQIRITLDDNLVIIDAEAATLASPYKICPSVSNGFESLKGLQIGPGWRRKVQSILGGVRGCTHLRDLLTGPIAVTAYQTIIPSRRDNEYQPKPNEKPSLINTCVAFSENGQIVKDRWPKYFSKNKEKY